jgi:ribosomal protein L40E
MNQRILTIVSAAVAVVAGFFVIKNIVGGADGYGGNNANWPEGIYYICGNESCKAQFNLTVEQLSDVKLKDPLALPVCPKCGDNHPIRADKCKTCGGFFVMRREDPRCPSCEK